MTPAEIREVSIEEGDERRLILDVSYCDAEIASEVNETDTQVTITVTHGNLTGNDCGGGVVVKLDDPLGERSVIDGATGQPVDDIRYPTDATEELVPRDQSETRPATGDGGPFDPQAVVRPDLLEVRPDPASLGQLVELHFPEGTERGIGYSLEARVGDTWELRFVLSSSIDEDQDPGWERAEDREKIVGWPDLAISGPGPDHVEVPDVAEPGQYRICTANTKPNFCRKIAVTR